MTVTGRGNEGTGRACCKRGFLVKTTDFFRLDIRELRKGGVFREGVRLDLLAGELEVLELDRERLSGVLTVGGEVVHLHGWHTAGEGVGWWLVCPGCGALRFWLASDGVTVQGCRGCLGLLYPAQRRRGMILENEARAWCWLDRADREQAEGHTVRARRSICRARYAAFQQDLQDIERRNRRLIRGYLQLVGKK